MEFDNGLLINGISKNYYLADSIEINKPYYSITVPKDKNGKYSEYIINVWTNNEAVFKEIILHANTEEELKKITDKYDKGIVDFFNIYLGIDSITNYIDEFAPRPEFLLTNEKIKSEKDLDKVIKKYSKYWRDGSYRIFCIDILKGLYHNRRIIHMSKVPIESLGIKFIQTREDFNKCFNQDNNRLWGYFIRCTKKAISMFY